jgi:hypothetical protein
MPPYEKLKSLPEAESYLRPMITFETLDAIANQMSDNQFAERMVKARSNLFQQISTFASRVAWSPFIRAHFSIRIEFEDSIVLTSRRIFCEVVF